MKNVPGILNLMIKLMMILSFFGLSLHAYGEHDGGPSHSTSQNGGRPTYDGATVNAEVENNDETNQDVARIVEGLDKKKKEQACAGYDELQRARCENPKTGEISAL